MKADYRKFTRSESRAFNWSFVIVMVISVGITLGFAFLAGYIVYDKDWAI